MNDRQERRPHAGITFAVFLVALLTILPGLGTQNVWSRDEARPALAARDMLSTGRWMIPHVGGRIDTQKPPLFPWVVALVSPRRVSEWSLRLPSAVAAAATVAVTYVLGARLMAPAAGMVAAAMLASSVTFYHWARIGRMEMLLVLFITLGCWSLVRWLEDGRARHAALLGVWVALGILTKGPVALLPAAVAAIVVALRRPRRAVLRHAGLCALTTSLLLLLWLGAAWLTSDDFGSYVSALAPMLHTELVEPRSRSLLPLIAGGFLPWTLTLPAAAVVLGRSWRTVFPALLVPVVWTLAMLIVFGTMLAPREPYFLPLYPALALLVAGVWQVASARWLALLFHPLGIAGLAAVVLAGMLLLSAHPAAVPVGDGALALDLSASTVGAGALLSLAVMLGGVLLRAGRRAPAAVVTAAGIVGVFLVVENGIRTPALNRAYPTRAAAAAFAARIPPAASVVYIDHRHLTAVAFYLPRPSIQVLEPSAFRAFAGRPDVLLLLVAGDEPFTADGRPMPMVPLASVSFDGIGYVLARLGNGAGGGIGARGL